MRLGLAEPFARRIERDRRLVEQRLQIGQPALGLRHAFRQDDEESRRKSTRERREHDGVARPGQPADGEPRAGNGNRVEHARERRQRADGIDQRRKCHYAAAFTAPRLERSAVPRAMTASANSTSAARMSSGVPNGRRADPV